MVATAIIGSAVVGAGASALSANSAAKAQTTAAANSNALLQRQYDQTRADLAPYRDAGSADFSKYNDLLGTGAGGAAGQMSALQSMPGYQFQLTQGLKAAQNSAAARGLGVSGAALKGASTYATGLANSSYAALANQLLQGAQVGANAAAGTDANGTTIAGAQAGNITGAGNAVAAGNIATGNAISSGLNNGLNSYFLSNALTKNAGGGLYAAALPGGYTYPIG